MQYQTYTTDAIVLAVTPTGEANVRALLITRDFGVVRGQAQRVRDVSSKLRFALQWLSLARVSMVYGKGGWRIVNALPLISFAGRLRRAGMPQLKAAARIALMVRRLVAGEERNTQLFVLVREAFTRLASRAISEAEARAIERITVLRVCAMHGYLEADERLAPLVHSPALPRSLCRRGEQLRRRIVRAINRSVEESHL